MNVNDIEKVEQTDNYWLTMFKRQMELLEKYHPIELKVMKIDSLYGNLSWSSIDNQLVQLRIKEYLWRICEEIGESYECIQVSSEEDDVDIVHQMEELADALHFYIELLILLGITEDQIKSLEILTTDYNKYKLWDQYEFYLNAFTALAKVGNCLKNKPWKQTQIRTDRVYLESKLEEFLQWLIFIFFSNGLKIEDIYNMYMKKSMVNKFRQDTKY